MQGQKQPFWKKVSWEISFRMAMMSSFGFETFDAMILNAFPKNLANRLFLG
jgi:hypothetical protein